MPLALTDAELDQIMDAARPLDPVRRDAFVRTVATELASCLQLGPGAMHRATRAVQPQFWQAPDLGHTPGSTSKYR